MDNLIIGNDNLDGISAEIRELSDKFKESDKPSLDELRELICVGKSPTQLLQDRIAELELLVKVILAYLPAEEKDAILKTFHQSLSAHYMKITSRHQTKG